MPGLRRRLRRLPRRARRARARSTSTSRSTARSRRCSATARSGAAVQRRARHLLVDEFQDLTPGPRAAGPAAGDARRSTCSASATTTRRSTATPAPTRVPHRLRATSSRAPSDRARGQLPLPGGDRRRRHQPARLQPRPGAEGDPGRGRRRSGSGRARDSRPARRRGGDDARRARPRLARRAGGRARATSPCSPASTRCCSRPQVALFTAGVPVASAVRGDVLERTGMARRARLAARRGRSRRT